MTRTIVLFEDHTSQQFRPMSWSLPVYEIPCGVFNLRERIQHLVTAGEKSITIVYLPRGYLAPLQQLSLGNAFPIGIDACLEANLEDVLFLSARLGPDWATLKILLNDLAMGEALHDAHGLLAGRLSRDMAQNALQTWRAWDMDCETKGAWSGFTTKADPWETGIPVTGKSEAGLGYLWDIVPLVGHAIEHDLAALTRCDDPVMPKRSVFGAITAESSPDPFAGGPLRLTTRLPDGVTVTGGGGLWLGEDVKLNPGVVIDTSQGPVVLDRGSCVLPHAYLEGPLYLGSGARVKAGATIYGETAIGGVCRVSGEIAESQLLPYMNKQHAGFLGHAVVGSWVNLGADTTNSDLKNNYGEIKVNFGLGPIETGSRLVGLMMAEHAKSAIGTTFNTGTTVGFSSNIFSAGFPRTCLANFTWGDGRGNRTYDVERAIEVARIVMPRRDCRFTDAHEALFRRLIG